MCTAATYQTRDFYFGRTLDYEFSYPSEVTVTPRRFPLSFRHTGSMNEHYAIIGMAYVANGYPLYYDAINEKGLGSILLAMPPMPPPARERKISPSLNSSPGFWPIAPICGKPAPP